MKLIDVYKLLVVIEAQIQMVTSEVSCTHRLSRKYPKFRLQFDSINLEKRRLHNYPYVLNSDVVQTPIIYMVDSYWATLGSKTYYLSIVHLPSSTV